MKNKFLLGCFAFLFGIVGITSAKELNLKKHEKQIKARIAKVINETNQIETDRLILRKPHGVLDKKGNLLDNNGKIVFTKDNKIIENKNTPLSGIRKDAEQIFQYAKDPEVAKLTGWQTHENIIDSYRFIRKILNGYKNNTEYIFLIQDKETSKILGSCGIVHISPANNEGELSFSVGASSWGKGFTGEAVKSLYNWGINKLKLNSIYALSFPDNLGSIGVMKKIGLKYDKTIQYPVKGKVFNIVKYSSIQNPIN